MENHTCWNHVSSKIRPQPGKPYNVTITLSDGKRFVTTLMFMGDYEWDTSEVILLDKSEYEITHFAELPEPAQDIPNAETLKAFEDTDKGIGLT